jgi:IPT/TIG domain
MSDPWKFKCRFTSMDRDIPPKFIPAYFINDTTVLCSSPGGWGRGDSVHVQLTLNGVDYSDNNFIFFYYNIGRHHPKSGPSNGKNIKITVDGSGFRNESKIVCVLDKALYLPLNVYSDSVVCPVPPAKGGPDSHQDVDFAIIIDGIWHNFNDGFTYYQQIEVFDV